MKALYTVLSDRVYDALGRLAREKRNGNANLLTGYSYNVRSWLTGITGGKFTQNLHYNTGTGTSCFNGNISSMTWKAGSESTVRGYRYTYDGLNRLTNAAYGETPSISSNANRFSEKVTGYDKNGNITALQRYGQTSASAYGLVDNQTFSLNGNQLNRVDDAVTASAYNGGFEFKDAVKQADEYAYDANGNLTKDLNKGIAEIQYNFLNLPSLVTFADGSTIAYLYAADGTKLRTVHTIGGATTTTDYCGNVIYENGVAKLLLTETGYITLSDKKYHYYLQDHQGNNRVVIDQNGSVEETNHYYPFGGVFASSGNVQPYKYNGKEFDAKKGLNWYDYGARRYDAALGRWHVLDLLNESTYSNAYAYCLNNPVRYIDVMGLDTINVNNLTQEIWKEKFNPQNDVITLNQVTVIGNNSNASLGMSALNLGMTGIGTASSSLAGMRYTERPWGSGYFTTNSGKTYPLSILGKQSSGKYVRGVQGLRIGAETAKKSTRLLRGIGNGVGYIGLGLNLANLRNDVNMRNFSDLGSSLISLIYWEFGVAYTTISAYIDWVVVPQIQQLHNNIENGLPATRNLYNPQTGMYEY